MEHISEETLARSAQGDLKAFEEIYRAASGFVYTTALRITNNRADAQEVTQDVFLKIYKHLGKFQAGTSLKAWIYRITVNGAINVYNKNLKEHGRRADFETAMATTAAGGQPAAADRLHRGDTLDQLAALLNLLSPEQRACLLLREIEGLNYREISGVLDLNINTVKTRVKRARETLFLYGRKKLGGAA